MYMFLLSPVGPFLTLNTHPLLGTMDLSLFRLSKLHKDTCWNQTSVEISVNPVADVWISRDSTSLVDVKV